MFGRATIRLGIGPHSSLILFHKFSFLNCYMCVCVELMGHLTAVMQACLNGLLSVPWQSRDMHCCKFTTDTY